MNWFCCDRYYSLGCHLDCDCLVLEIEAEQDGDYIVEYSYYNSSVIHVVEIKNVLIGDFLKIDKALNFNNFIHLKIIQPDGTYLSQQFLDHRGDPFLDEYRTDEFGDPLPITSECFTLKTNLRRNHYATYQDLECEDCDVENGYAVINFNFYDLINRDIHYIQFGNRVVNLSDLDGPIEGDGLSGDDIESNILSYFNNLLNSKIANFVKETDFTIMNMGGYLRIKMRNDFADLCDNEILFLDERFNPLDLQSSEFECCLEEQYDDECQFSEEDATFYITFNQPIYNKFRILINTISTNDNYMIESSGFDSFNELDDIIDELNNKYNDYRFERFDKDTIIMYTNKFKCDSLLNFVMRSTNSSDYFDINYLIDRTPNLEPYCCNECDFEDVALLTFNSLVDMPGGFYIYSAGGVRLFDFPSLLLSDIPTFISDTNSLYPDFNVYQDVDGINIEIPYDNFDGLDVCGERFNIYEITNSSYFLQDQIQYNQDNIIRCCYTN